MKDSTKKVLDIRANVVKYDQRIIKKCRNSDNPAETFRLMKIGFEGNAQRAVRIAETRRAKELAAEIVRITDMQISRAQSYLSKVGVDVQ